MIKLIVISVVYSVFAGGAWQPQTAQEVGYADVTCREIIKTVRTNLGQAEGFRFETAECSEQDMAE